MRTEQDLTPRNAPLTPGFGSSPKSHLISHPAQQIVLQNQTRGKLSLSDPALLQLKTPNRYLERLSQLHKSLRPSTLQAVLPQLLHLQLLKVQLIPIYHGI